MSAAREARQRTRVLVVEDDSGLQRQLKWALDSYELVFAGSREEALAAVRRYRPPVVLQDLGLPPDPEGATEGFATLRETLAIAPQAKVIVITGNADRDNALKAVGQGAYDFYQKPLDVQLLNLIVGRAVRIAELEEENRRLVTATGNRPIDGIIAADEGMLRLCRTIEKVAPSGISVLLCGESGTGKELLARALHDLSARASQRFVAINCAAIPENLLESELFGHERGAFTGAHKTTPGKVEIASGGTLFLDEIGDMPMPLQAKMLRFLQERVVERVGGRQEIPVDVRIVCATNQDLQQRIAAQLFREDLYYRIGEVTLRVPPLRERRGGIGVLAHAFLRRYSTEYHRPVKGFSPDALAGIEAFDWPGNVRELESRIKAAVIMAEGSLLTAPDLGLAAVPAAAPLTLREARAEAERRAILGALEDMQGNMSAAAERLGISRPTLYDLIERLGLQGMEGK